MRKKDWQRTDMTVIRAEGIDYQHAHGLAHITGALVRHSNVMAAIGGALVVVCAGFDVPLPAFHGYGCESH